jgi:hypothetical protein
LRRGGLSGRRRVGLGGLTIGTTGRTVTRTSSSTSIARHVSGSGAHLFFLFALKSGGKGCLLFRGLTTDGGRTPSPNLDRSVHGSILERGARLFDLDDFKVGGRDKKRLGTLNGAEKEGGTK